MQKAGQYLVSLYFWCGLFLFSAILFPISFVVWALTVPFDRRLFILHKYTCLWSTIVLSLNPIWKIRVYRKDKIGKGVTYVMVSNHQSGMDIIVLFKLWAHFKWVAKRSLFYYPFIGWNMWLNRYISLERGKSSSMRKMMTDAERTLKSGNSVMIFPEGTRSLNGKLQPFKTGAFHIALQAGVPILPIAISGTSEAVRKGGFLVSKNFNIRAQVLDPVPYESFAELDPREVAEMVHKLIAEQLEK
jgi:1-acyl-sn-glycerol-3-phosphate acyltransferase